MNVKKNSWGRTVHQSTDVSQSTARLSVREM